jgi:xylose isomerase
MDAFARGLKIAAAIRADGVLNDFVRQRYSTYDNGMGRRIEAGSVSLNELDTYIQESTSLTANTSGRQEMLENLINRYI